MTTSIEDAVRAWAKGIYPTEAGVELLIRAGKSAVYEGAPWITRSDDDELAAIDVTELLDGTGAWSGGERRIVRIAASLLSGSQPVSLNDDLPNLDRRHLTLVLAAIAHAAGSHEQSEMIFDEDENGRPIGGQIKRLEAAYPWPA